MDEIKDADQIKNEVLQKTAEYAFKNILAEKAEDIPFEIIFAFNYLSGFFHYII